MFNLAIERSYDGQRKRFPHGQAKGPSRFCQNTSFGSRALVDKHKVLEGILWMSETVVPFDGDYETGRNRGLWLDIWRAFLVELDEKRQLD